MLCALCALPKHSKQQGPMLPQQQQQHIRAQNPFLFLRVLRIAAGSIRVLGFSLILAGCCIGNVLVGCSGIMPPVACTRRASTTLLTSTTERLSATALHSLLHKVLS